MTDEERWNHLIHWAKKNGLGKCPTHGGDKIRSSISKWTSWCEVCQRVWKVTQDVSRKWPPPTHWYYLDKNKYLESNKNKYLESMSKK